MSKMVELNLDPDEKTLKSFGFIGFVGFGLIAAMAYTNSFIFSFGLGSASSIVAGVFGLLSVYCLLASLVAPLGNKWVYVGLAVVTFPIGIVLSYTIMLFLFFVVFGSIALLLRLFRYDPMNRKLDENADSYWSDARPSRPTSDYFKQY